MALKFRELAKSQQRRIALAMTRAAAQFSYGGEYAVVGANESRFRERARIETGYGEDSALPAYSRLKMLNLARQGMRNGDGLRGIMRQLELNVVGTVGGKAIFDFDDLNEVSTEEFINLFSEWTKHCEFSDSLSFSRCLQLIVDTKFLGGDLVLLFDDGLIEDSGKLLIFEPDEIADIAQNDFQAKFPSYYRQRQGRIYNENNRFIGVNVSRSQRGKTIFDSGSYFTLMVNESKYIQDWVMLRELWRFNQGRGVPAIAAPLDTTLDQESIVKSEVQAARMNSQLLGQVLQSSGTQTDADEFLDFAHGERDENGNYIMPTTESAAEGVDSETELEAMDSVGALYDIMPENTKMELMDTKRPNPNVEGFVKFLAGRAGAAVGLAKCYSLMEANTSYTAFRGEQVMTRPMFREWQKNLEREVCDWVIQKFAIWANRKGFLTRELPINWQYNVSWQWPELEEVDGVASENMKRLKLQNGTATFRELYGANWRKHIEQIGKDIADAKRLGWVHPICVSQSGQDLTASEDTRQETRDGI